MATSSEKLKLIISAQNQASGTLNNLRNQVIAVGAAYLGWEGVKDIIGGIINAGMESEQAWNDVTASLKRHGLEVENNRSRIQRFATEMQKLTGVSDETIGKTIQGFLDYGQTVDEAMRTTRVAMDLAAGTGMDLKAATDLLAKAAVGYTSTLSRYGIIIDENIPKSEKFAAAIQQINERFGGAASSRAGDFVTRLNVLKESWGDLQETMSVGLLPKAGTGIEVAIGFVDGLNMAMLSSQSQAPNTEAAINDLRSEIMLMEQLGAPIDTINKLRDELQKLERQSQLTEDAIKAANETSGDFGRGFGIMLESLMVDLGAFFGQTWEGFKKFNPIGTWLGVVGDKLVRIGEEAREAATYADGIKALNDAMFGEAAARHEAENEKRQASLALELAYQQAVRDSAAIHYEQLTAADAEFWDSTQEERNNDAAYADILADEQLTKLEERLAFKLEAYRLNLSEEDLARLEAYELEYQEQIEHDALMAEQLVAQKALEEGITRQAASDMIEAEKHQYDEIQRYIKGHVANIAASFKSATLSMVASSSVTTLRIKTMWDGLAQGIKMAFAEMVMDAIASMVTALLTKMIPAMIASIIKTKVATISASNHAAALAAVEPWTAPARLAAAATVRTGLMPLALGFDDPANDIQALRHGRDYADFFMTGIQQRFAAPGFGADMVSNVQSIMPKQSAPAPATTNITLQFNGPVTDESFVRNVIVPAIEKLRLNDYTRVALDSRLTTGTIDMEFA